MPVVQEGLLDHPQTWKPASDPPSSPRLRAKSLFWQVVKATRPSFAGLKNERSNTKLRETAYLDGLRGFAAFLVYILHHELWAHSALNHADRILENGFGHHGNFYFACLPFIRNFFTGGHIAVGCFFVISGYVLTLKPLTMINNGEYGKLGDNLASAIFRRWFRLWVPIAIVTFLYATFLHLTDLKGPHQMNTTWLGEVWDWYVELKNYSFVFNMGGKDYFYLNDHIWTIPCELRGSLVVYLACLSFARFSRNARLYAELALLWYFMWIVDGWFVAYFVAGMILADLDVLAKLGNLPRWIVNLAPYQEMIWYSLFMIGMFFAGVPSQSNELEDIRVTPGWYWLSFLKPQAVFAPKWFYLFFGAVPIVAVIPRIHFLKAFFESRFCQFMGRISYCFYLAHGPVLWLVGGRLYSAVGLVREGLDETEFPGWPNAFPIPHIGPLGLESNFLLVNIITLPLTLWLGDVMTKLIDEPCVRAAGNLWRKLQPSSSPSVSLPVPVHACLLAGSRQRQAAQRPHRTMDGYMHGYACHYNADRYHEHGVT
ncbi:hypothetical protein EJ05DRAFT_491938 [Pseudovirgaria hyperparasitica]|uniref:Acyltransferase 3 domain-containing protein n=1 Tax=Pseudovirgaria hyperparasitica TaxID=470096 RepID=A0A6A6WH15_9PEZI|nr:uncharacterized protein EJ05DRAFT_491938 [Pseudovirgaria hyperparasitica]KAF2761276.1 hypothetical protein EJ05DRAFT_491938 [Pseudovirgaria hyperparasitica]